MSKDFTPNLWEVCGRMSPSGGHTWNNIYASLALGLRVVTDRLLVLPCTGGGCSTIPGGKTIRSIRHFSHGCIIHSYSNSWDYFIYIHFLICPSRGVTQQIIKSVHRQPKCPLTFEPLIFSHHPLKDHSDNLSDSGSCCVVGDVVLGEVQAETQHDCLATTRGSGFCILSSEPKLSAFVVQVRRSMEREA